MKFFILSLLIIVSTNALAKSTKISTGEESREKMEIQLPDDFEEKSSWPLIVSLHGFKGRIATQKLLMRLGAHQDKKGFVLANLSGTVNSKGQRFWNASQFCCDFDQSKVDDVAYIDSAIESIAKQYKRIDLSRIYLVGHSNGGFMANKMACESKFDIAGIVNFAGSMDLREDNDELCPQRKPLTVIHIHGTNDQTIRYAGHINASSGIGHLSAEKDTKFWAQHNQCQAVETKAHEVDVEYFGASEEVLVTKYSQCADNKNVTLLSLINASHSPLLKPAFISRMIDLLFQ